MQQGCVPRSTNNQALLQQEVRERKERRGGNPRRVHILVSSILMLLSCSLSRVSGAARERIAAHPGVQRKLSPKKFHIIYAN
jgi:hypothetical protein